MVKGLNLATKIFGHDRVLMRFRQAIARGHFPHACLFVGPSGIGKKKMAFALAQELCCEHPSSLAEQSESKSEFNFDSEEGSQFQSDLEPQATIHTEACGVCGACVRIANLYRQLTAPAGKGSEISATLQSDALLFLQPEKNQIRIEQTHAVIDFLNLRLIGKARIVIIDQVETLNPAAANSILKVLEEPPDNTYFFLIAPTPRHVLPTLRSRSQLVHFAPVPPEQMKRALTKHGESALRASQGSFERLELLTEAEEIKTRDLVMAWLYEWSAGDPVYGYLRPDFRDAVRDRQQAMRFAGHLLVLMRDLAFFKMGHVQEVFHQEQQEWLAQVSQFCELDDLFYATEKAGEVVRALTQNLDANLQFEKFWLMTRKETPSLTESI